MKCSKCQAEIKTSDLFSESEKSLLLSKMIQATHYQDMFGKDGDEKLKRIADNCNLIAFSFFVKKLDNLIDSGLLIRPE